MKTLSICRAKQVTGRVITLKLHLSIEKSLRRFDKYHNATPVTGLARFDENWINHRSNPDQKESTTGK